MSQTHTQYVTLVCVCLLNVRNSPRSGVTFCGCPFLAVLCVNCVSVTGKEKHDKTARHFKFNTAVNMNFKNLRLVNPCTFVQAYQSFGSNSSLHLKHILKKVAVLSLKPLPVCSIHNVSRAGINQPTTNKHTQPSIKYFTFI